MKFLFLIYFLLEASGNSKAGFGKKMLGLKIPWIHAQWPPFIEK